MAINSLRHLKHLSVMKGSSLFFQNLSLESLEKVEICGFGNNYHENLKLFVVNNRSVRELILWCNFGGVVNGSNLIFIAAMMPNLKILKAKTVKYTPGLIRIISKQTNSIKIMKLYLSSDPTPSDVRFMAENKDTHFCIDESEL